MSKRICVIGAGLSGLSVSAHLARKGFEVEVFEKNEIPGGRARAIISDGFTFNMEPSWYWTPEIAERFYNTFGHTTSDFYNLKRLDPGYRFFFANDEYIDIPASIEQTYELFESIEKNSARKLKTFLQKAAEKYNDCLNEKGCKTQFSVSDFFWQLINKGLFRQRYFRSIATNIRSQFRDPRIIQILEFPVLLFGGNPHKTSPQYSMINYIDMSLGNWYPEGGMQKVIESMLKILNEYDVQVHFDNNIERIDVINNKVAGVYSHHKNMHANYYVAATDIHHIEELLYKDYRNYSEKFWHKMALAPSTLLFFLGIKKKVKNLQHHNFILEDTTENLTDNINKNQKWTESPSFYVSCSSITDKAAAPSGMEGLVVIVPIAQGLEDTGRMRQHYYNIVLDKLTSITGQNIKDHIVFRKSYGQSDFIHDFNVHSGNIFGMANNQLYKSAIKNRHLSNLFYTGTFAFPVPGISRAIISGERVANEVEKNKQ